VRTLIPFPSARPVPKLATVGVIAADLGQPLHRVNYVIAAHGIREAARVGTLRVFDRAAVDRIRELLTSTPGPKAKGVARG
jgi:hypothetical protein